MDDIKFTIRQRCFFWLLYIAFKIAPESLKYPGARALMDSAEVMAEEINDREMERPHA